jgi:hypothetical protein
MSIQCNPGALKEVLKEIMKPLFIIDLDIVDFEWQVKELYAKIK